jgi:hypothetical protein
MNGSYLTGEGTMSRSDVRRPTARRSTGWVGAAVAVVFLAGATAAHAGVIAGYDPARNDRFVNFPSAPTENPTFFQSTFDFSGVGWRLPGINAGSAWNVSMIDDRHFVGAFHVPNNGVMAVGDTLTFRSGGPTPVTLTRQISRLQQVPNADNSPSDVLLGTLAVPFTPADRIAAYAIPTGNDVLLFSNQTVFNYDLRASVGRNTVSGSTLAGPSAAYSVNGSGDFAGTGNTRYFFYDDDTGFNDDAFPGFVPPLDRDEFRTEAGDSGSPTFLPVGGALQLLGARYALASGTFGVTPINISFDSFLPAYRDQILAMTAVPEPSSLALCTAALAAAAAGYRRARRRAA